MKLEMSDSLTQNRQLGLLDPGCSSEAGDEEREAGTGHRTGAGEARAGSVADDGPGTQAGSEELSYGNEAED